MAALVTIGLPVFNDRQFLELALQSLLDQTHSDFELIVSDDASTDGSRELCLEFAARDSRIRYIRQPVNLGISRNMKFLLQQAGGKYFMWAGDDDLWHPKYVETLVGALQKEPDLVSVVTPAIFVDEEGNRVSTEPVRKSDYSGRTPFKRLQKLVTIFDDVFGYGLFVREAILGVEFPVWWGVNRENAYNNIFPALCFYLSKGKFKLVGTEPMLLKRIKNPEHVHHKIPYEDTFVRGYLAFLLWKFNLVVVSLRQIHRAGHFGTAILAMPRMTWSWLGVPAWRELLSRGSKLIMRRISFF